LTENYFTHMAKDKEGNISKQNKPENQTSEVVKE
jgi:hypothetical protein